MTVITATTLRQQFADSVKTIAQEKGFMLVSNNRKITSALVDIDLFEDLLEASDKEFALSVQAAREEYERGEIFTHEELFGEL
jgi:PHD/YefM family antitoxin component YafN of YafNO toxin-antitoxin module